MRIAIPMLSDRVAPRCTSADCILLLTIRGNMVVDRSEIPLESATWADLDRVLADERVDTVVCGGISRDRRQDLRAHGITIIENVAGASDEIVRALADGKIKDGYGFSGGSAGEARRGDGRAVAEEARRPYSASSAGTSSEETIDCLACTDRICLRGLPCARARASGIRSLSPAEEEILGPAMDVACESERTLCRLAELVYFASGMGYQRLGLAFCMDLIEPAQILASVLRRFFDVIPVSCKVGGIRFEDTPVDDHRAESANGCHVAVCHASGQAAVLNGVGTDLNVVVGLCVGADCVFARESRAPVSTIFVKDKSLANNPIGAVYSHYHLRGI